MCTVLLPLGDNRIAVNKYVISYHIIVTIYILVRKKPESQYYIRPDAVCLLGQPHILCSPVSINTLKENCRKFSVKKGGPR